MAQGRVIALLAPAKINLTLHITGRREDGYHRLDSVVGFADIGDRILIEPAARFSFHVDGPFAAGFSGAERDDSAQGDNLAVRAAHRLAALEGKELQCRITLTKNLPLAAGLGGGSADAAATLWGLMAFWAIHPATGPWLEALALQLGADVPVCLRCAPARMRGIGEDITPMPGLPEVPVVLVCPMVACPTRAVFQHFAGPMRGTTPWPESIANAKALARAILACDNDLTPAAIEIVPEIRTVLAVLERQAGCAAARMCGSGATCFGIFHEPRAAAMAAAAIAGAQPEWWVRAGTLNTPVRY